MSSFNAEIGFKILIFHEYINVSNIVEAYFITTSISHIMLL